LLDQYYNISNPEPNIDEPDGYPFQEELIDDVYKGVLSPFLLPLSLYVYTKKNLEVEVFRAFKLSPKKERKFIEKSFKSNLSVFSGAKTFQELLELSVNVFNKDGTKKSFNDFKKVAKKIDNRYNVNWLFAEKNAAFRQANGAENWLQIQDDKESLPLLRYQTIGDERVRPLHEELDYKTYPVDHEFWDSWYPPNGWNCRCVVIQIESGKITKGSFKKNQDPIFGSNVGKTGLIFPKTHPYFDIPKKFKKAQKNNFGFGNN